ncbi:MAG: DUF4837 family protein [Bacteroidales bacterium]|jgi:hypothetical protein|nr:DUF4837 family protein [Bacteroidales bacterium]
MKFKIRSLIFLLVFTGLFSCSDAGNGIYKNITGRPGEVIVVISKQSWESTPGAAVREILAQPHAALPQNEPIFDIVNIPHAAFKEIFKSTRNIVQTNIYSSVNKEGIIFKDNAWAYPQATIQINAKSNDRFVEILNKNKEKILSYFLAAEKARLTANYNKYYEEEVYNVLGRDFGVTIKVPPGFRVMTQKKDFLWIQYDTPEIFQGILLYTFPYVSDSAFTVNYQLCVRDSIMKANIPGPTTGSYMNTEKNFDQINSFTRHNSNYANEMRGLWRVENDFMGGPYISLAVLDAAKRRVVVAFGYVYAPGKDKRNLLRQVEAMIYSLKFNNQEENDKLNQLIDFEVNVEG